MAFRAEPRRTPPLGAQLAAAKRQIIALMRLAGMISADVPEDSVRLECDHEPALGLRNVDPVTRLHVPHQHDDRYLVFRLEARHAVKTRGRGATTSGSDVGEMRKTRQLVKKRVSRGEIAPDDPAIAPWAPSQKTRSKPKKRFPRGRRLQSRNTFRREESAR